MQESINRVAYWLAAGESNSRRHQFRQIFDLRLAKSIHLLLCRLLLKIELVCQIVGNVHETRLIV